MSDTKNTTGSKSFAPPIGFRFGAVAAGVKEPGGARKDLALIASEIPCAAAGVVTVNKMCAAPVRYSATRFPGTGIRAIVANSGNANALTGPRRSGRRARHRHRGGQGVGRGSPTTF